MCNLKEERYCRVVVVEGGLPQQWVVVDSFSVGQMCRRERRVRKEASAATDARRRKNGVPR